MAADAPLPFELPSSEVVQRAKRNVGVCCALGVACLALIFGAEGGGTLDPLGFVAYFYAVFSFCFQSCYLEWPAVTPEVCLWIALAHGFLLGPSWLGSFGLWDRTPCRLLAWAVDVAFLIGTHRQMIRGPFPAELRAGSLAGKTCIVTGCNSGIGYSTAEVLAQAGATVVFACRTEGKAREAMRKVLYDAGGTIAEEQLMFLALDVSSFESVRRFAERFEETGLVLHRLILNAGVMLSSRSLSVDGLEMTMASNHFGHFLLVQLLLPTLLAAEKSGEQPRIVCVGSNMCYMHDAFDFSETVLCKGDDEKKAFLLKPYAMFRAYGQSKLANVHFATELARRLQKKGSKIPVNVVHPGEVMTEVMRDMNKTVLWLYAIFRGPMNVLLKTPLQGAACTLHVATAPELATSDSVSGGYFLRLSLAPLSKACADATAAARLWALSMELTGAPPVV